MTSTDTSKSDPGLVIFTDLDGTLLNSSYSFEAAMPALLGALMKADSDSRLRESSVHIIHSNSSQKVKSDSEELLKALKGPSANISSMEAAFELMEKWHIR